MTQTASEAEGMKRDMPPLVDSFARVARKLRIQVTDRCNYSCDFCMPPEPTWLDRASVLTYEEMARLSGIMAQMGVEKIRLSGGEPLVRRDVEKLVRLLAHVRGITTIGLTTNGSLLKEKASTLKENGLKSVTVSLHSLRSDRYDRITGTKGMLPRVLKGIHESIAVGLRPVKINCVVRRDNVDEIPEFARMAHDQGLSVRFIEYMPFDGKRFWDVDSLVSGTETIARVKDIHRLVPTPREPGATAVLYRFADGSEGDVGVIASMTKPFCGDCDRIRLTVDGKIVPCLFSTNEYDIKTLLRKGATDDELADFIRKCFWLKSEGVESMIKQNTEFDRIRPMYTIGG
jgi:cyclic pyranopterin phosphate synthase